jgi:D-glycero-beta-D-manno-heptose-7-phosphate kinase
MNFLVIGDACIDRYLYGSCPRICPEAPVPVFVEESRVVSDGMAGNVAANLRSLAGHEHTVATIFTPATIIKTRYVDATSNQMLLRVDNDGEIDEAFDRDAVDLEDYDAVIVSDYNKGFLSEDDLEHIARFSNLSFLDTKKPYGEWAAHFDFIKINQKEAEQGGYLEADHGGLIVTRGADGCWGNETYFPANEIEKLFDVCGAGDTFLAAFALTYTLTKDIKHAIDVAQNCCATVIGKRGTAVC